MIRLIRSTANKKGAIYIAVCVAALATVASLSPAAYAQDSGTPVPSVSPAPVAPSESTTSVPHNPAADANLLYYAAQGDVAKFEKFLQAGGSVRDARRKDGQTVLMLAASKGSLPIVQMALKQNADINAPDNLGTTALMLASRSNFPEIIDTLIAAGAKLESKNVNGMTALHLAVQAQQLESVNALLAKSANIKAKDNWNNTPLMLAASGQARIVQALLGAGAEVNARNLAGKTALSLAITKKNPSAAAQLRAAGGFQ